jgi:hypothetical protein
MQPVNEALRAATVGDLFILLTPLTEGELPWQRTLQARFGGICTAPLHVTCRRFVCSDQVLLQTATQALQQQTQHLTPMPVIGLELLPLDSEFRQNQILKCRVQMTAAILALDAIIEQVFLEHNIVPHFASVSNLVTVLEGIEPLPAEAPIAWDECPCQLFVGRQLSISALVASQTFEIQWRWPLTSQTG